MMKDKVGSKRELPLVRVLIRNIKDDGKVGVVCQVTNKIVPKMVVDTVKLLMNDVTAIMPEEAVMLYLNTKKPLIDFLIVYGHGSYSIEVECPQPILQVFDSETNRITGLLDRAVQNF